MRYRIVKETFANEEYHFYIKKKGLIFWSRLLNHYECTDYFENLEGAMAKLEWLIGRHLATKVVDIQVVYDTKVAD